MKRTIAIGMMSLALIGAITLVSPSSTQAQTAQAALTFSSDLLLGSKGADVSALQTWLMGHGYSIPSVSSGAAPKGYFGIQTKSALVKYQSSVGLNATGFFGPLTRAKINVIADGSGGTAGPLAITSPNGGESWQKGTSQTITWTSPAYFRATTVDLKLNRQLICTTQVCPAIAYAPLIIATGVPANQNYYAWNVGVLQSAYGLTDGMGVVRDTAPDGQYTISICETGGSSCDASDAVFNIYTQGSTSQVPTISGFDAPSALRTGEAGTWTIHASDPLNGQLTYSVIWGDEALKAVSSPSASIPQQFIQATSFTHVYANAGVYTVKVTVRNSSGLTAQTSATVRVSLVGGEIQAGYPQCPAGYVCTPVTY